ncbi:hypothetical protein OOJ91_12115 [Micromonospora lupini]|uniref:hypothetical protein n=1 Tax=Micromonospora lupini TaxID=285679 RepID=UPI00224D59DB|nr:hypothetical protein [Micromonospora lupini]MCX5066623.1 hypothetical protein [Micromonospora lupini]
MSYLNPHTTGSTDASEAVNAWHNRPPVADQDVERTDRTGGVLYEVARERSRQDARWGEQNHPDSNPEDHYTGRAEFAENAERWKLINAERAGRGAIAWDGVLLEEVFEALAEDDPVKLRAELVQVAAVAVAQIEAIDRRQP